MSEPIHLQNGQSRRIIRVFDFTHAGSSLGKRARNTGVRHGSFWFKFPTQHLPGKTHVPMCAHTRIFQYTLPSGGKMLAIAKGAISAGHSDPHLNQPLPPHNAIKIHQRTLAGVEGKNC